MSLICPFQGVKAIVLVIFRMQPESADAELVSFACRWLAQLLANVGLKHPDPMFAEITEPTQPLPLPPPE